MASRRVALCTNSRDAGLGHGVGNPSKVAFRYVRGGVGWARSPIGHSQVEDDNPDADDLEDEFGDSWVAVAAAANGSTLCAPLSEHASLDLEAKGWAENWAVEADYVQPEFPTRLLVEPDPITLWAFDQAIASFPIGTGLGSDNIAPRVVLRLGDTANLAIGLRL